MLRRGVEGEVMLKVLVGVDGKPLKIEVEKSSGYRDFDRSAMQAAKRWRFNPGSKGGVPYDTWVLVPVKFSLRG